MKRVLPIRDGTRWIALSICQLLASFLCGCFVDGHCRLDEDCASPKICNDDRFCVLECLDDGDCALSDTCDAHRCEPAPGCAGCSFAHTEAICVHGDCSMGTCAQGWVDANTRANDGCEYACEITGDEVCDGADCDALVDEELLCCPENMVSVDGVFCIDVYEASIEETEDGDLLAVSLPGVAPFWDRDLTVEQASAYCEAAGKRLCNPTEWVQTCRGPDELLYRYGDEYEPTICSGIDAFGEGSYHMTLTASFESCTNDYGIFDINGNVWEMASDGLMRGGAYNCRDSATLHQCTYSIEPSRVIAIGFRCCL